MGSNEGNVEGREEAVGVIEMDTTPFTADEVEAVLGKLKNNKSRGGSWIASELLRGYEHDDLT